MRLAYSKKGSALQDIVKGATMFRLWATLALHDVRLRYRGSILGPFWVTVSTAILITALGLIYPKLFGLDTTEYLPYLAVGLVVWQFILTQINEACSTFSGSYSIIHQIKLPYSVWVYRSVFRNFITFAHNVVVIVVVFLFVGIVPPITLLWHVFVGVLLLLVNGIWMCLFLGMLGARFRDIPPMITNFMTLAFFVTPIFWFPINAGEWWFLIQLNPFFAIIDLIRSPLLGSLPEATSLPISIAVAVFGLLIAFMVFAKYRARIPFWA